MTAEGTSYRREREGGEGRGKDTGSEVVQCGMKITGVYVETVLRGGLGQGWSTPNVVASKDGGRDSIDMHFEFIIIFHSNKLYSHTQS